MNWCQTPLLIILQLLSQMLTSNQVVIWELLLNINTDKGRSCRFRLTFPVFLRLILELSAAINVFAQILTLNPISKDIKQLKVQLHFF